MNKKVFVSGVTGLQESNIAKQFIAQGGEVVALSSKIERSTTLGLKLLRCLSLFSIK